VAAPFQNYSGGVLLADIVKRNNLSTYVSEAIKERSLFVKSGAVVRTPLLDAREGGTRIQVPEFNPVSPTEEIMNGTATWGTSNAGYLTPQKIGTATQIASICHRGFAYAVDDVAMLAAGEDPMLHIRNQLADAINKLNSQRLFSQLYGLFGASDTNNGPLGANGLYKGKGAASGATEVNFLTGATIAEARAKLGERGDELDILVVHPSVGFYLYQVGLLTFSTSALAASGAVTWGGGGVGIGARSIGEFAGCRVIIDPLVNTVAPGDSGDQREFNCYLAKSGTILEGVQQDLRIEADRNILSKQDVLSVDYHGAYHVMGTKWTSASDNPTNAQLYDKDNWTATYDIDLIPLVRIVVNSPLDTSTI
jgi:hypothetical protein